MKTKLHEVFSRIFLIFFIFISGTACVSAVSNLKPDKVVSNANVSDLKIDFLSATGILFISYKDLKTGEKQNGNCTAVAFAKNGQKYRFFTAAHCVTEYNKNTSETIFLNPEVNIVLESSKGDLRFYKAKVLAVGEKKNFEDFAVLEVEIDDEIPIVPLSKDGPKLDEDVQVATFPIGPGAGVLYLRGYVSKERFVNLVTGEDIKAEGSFGVQIVGLGTAQGVSGGGVFSVNRGAIVGIAVASIYNSQGHVSIVVVSIEKFNNFYKEYLEGKRPLVIPQPPKLQKKESPKKVNPKKTLEKK